MGAARDVNNKKGVILLTIVAIMLALTIMAAAFSYACMLKVQLYEGMYNSTAAYCIASAGYYSVRSNISTDGSQWFDSNTGLVYVPAEYEIDFGDGQSADIETAYVGSNLHIQVVGRYKNAIRTISVLRMMVPGQNTDYVIQWGR